VRDRWGIPVARLSGTVHDETVRTACFMQGKATEWLEASGAVRTWSDPIVPRLSGGQHQAGTCRMGSDAHTSVTDKYGRVWGHTNLYISDASLHVTNGGFNPVLTILALAFRNGEHIACQLDGGLGLSRP
jgi:choline dehydrogenase-like flavoprotein